MDSIDFAERKSKRMDHRSVQQVIGLFSLAGVLTAVALVGCSSDDEGMVAGAKRSCALGDKRAVFGTGTRSVLLACTELSDGRQVELLSQISSGGLCLQIAGLDKRVRECGNAPSEQVPPKTSKAISAQAIAQL